jgi:hypothetical protein
LTTLNFAKNHNGQPDVAMFDFTSLFQAENSSRIVERNNKKLFMSLVGDSLLEVRYFLQEIKITSKMYQRLFVENKKKLKGNFIKKF